MTQRTGRDRSEWDTDEEGRVLCASNHPFDGVCSNLAMNWMTCNGVESPVCPGHRISYEQGTRVVTCQACGMEGVRVAEHYDYQPL